MHKSAAIQTIGHERQAKRSPINSTQSTESIARQSDSAGGLPDHLKSRAEAISGFTLGEVKVHHNSNKPSRIKALAYTQGTDIYVSPGQERHLAHELWHVVQQKQGRVTPHRRTEFGEPLSEEPHLEREADVMGAQITFNGRPAHEEHVRMVAQAPSTRRPSTTIQLMENSAGTGEDELHAESDETDHGVYEPGSEKNEETLKYSYTKQGEKNAYLDFAHPDEIQWSRIKTDILSEEEYRTAYNSLEKNPHNQQHTNTEEPHNNQYAETEASAGDKSPGMDVEEDS